MIDRRAASIWGLVLAAASECTFSQCTAPRSVTPADAVTTEVRPRISWSAVAGATGYALSLQSRVPEGRLIASYDVSLGTNEFMPPAALTDEKATVTLAVTARCADAVAPTQTASFRIDATGICGATRGAAIDARAGTLRATWLPVAGAVHYEVRAFAPLDGKQIAALEVREPRAELAAAAVAGTVVSVKPRCAAAYGEAGFAVLAPR